ncbi:hypothetical protein [Nocardiopsis coralliicola]
MPDHPPPSGYGGPYPPGQPPGPGYPPGAQYGPPPQGPPGPPYGAGAGFPPPPPSRGTGSGNGKLFLILGLAGAAVLAVVLTLVFALGSPEHYSAMVRCSSADAHAEGLALDGEGPEAPSGSIAEEDAAKHASFVLLCEGEDADGVVMMTAMLLDPDFAEQDGAVEGRLDLVFSELSGDGSEEHDIEHGDYSRALHTTGQDEAQGAVAFTSGNLLVACGAEGEGAPEDRIDRALQACAAYEDAMKAGAPRD